MADRMEPIPGQIYRHFKNKLYQIVAIAYHSETGEKNVVYQALYGDYKVYIRPYDMFMSEVDHVKYPDVGQSYRFEQVDRESLNNINNVTSAVTDSKTDMKNDSNDWTNDEYDNVDSRLLKFLNCDTYAEKLEYLSSIRNNIDERLINDIAVSMDLTVNDGPLEDRYFALKNCIQTMARFECNRLR